ncbi:PilZ domain-containing protein [Alsobacter sp. SYSU M60028]|uniref:PilZ domain-containing protein n=1 Tax=Alsobacter ponti TaxID=2962936 RepID=A0ABT1LFC6_9HYPH|nr:PilZ domain-containing protein [Alsobacter ponti]MCP8940195.1 PilZ domain-containing protein [Alsobacter ponti]
MSVLSMPGVARIRSLLSQRAQFARVHQRLPCCVPGSLYFIDRDYEIDGLVLELSRGGVLFREASTYILDRRGCEVEVRLLDLRWPGTIVNCRTEGYGIRFRNTLDDAAVTELVKDYGLNPA